jgi:hypothetical protein
MKDVAPCRMWKKVDNKETANDYFETMNVIPGFMMFSLMNRIRNVVHSKQKQPFRMFCLHMFQTHIFELQ